MQLITEYDITAESIDVILILFFFGRKRPGSLHHYFSSCRVIR